MQQLRSCCFFRFVALALFSTELLANAIAHSSGLRSEQTCLLPSSFLQRSHKRVVSQPPTKVENRKPLLAPGVLLALGTAAQPKRQEADLLVQQAIKLREEAKKAKQEAAEAEQAARKAEADAQSVRDDEEICSWKLPTWCQASFQYRGSLRTGCVEGETRAQPWCSHDAMFSGSWSECIFMCEPRSRMESMTKRIMLGHPVQNFDGAGIRETHRGASNSQADGMDSNHLVPVLIPALNLQQSGIGIANRLSGGNVTSNSTGARASLDETGYMAVVAVCDSVEMAMFVRRVISQIGCLPTNEKTIFDFAPWYSGEYDVQSYSKLDRELRCLCTRGQGPQWLRPIDPENPPTGGLLKCTGRPKPDS